MATYFLIFAITASSLLSGFFLGRYQATGDVAATAEEMTAEESTESWLANPSEDDDDDFTLNDEDTL